MVRLTINLKEELYRIAKTKAMVEECSISEAVNQMLEQSLNAERKSRRTTGKRFPSVRGSRPFTSEDVYRVELEQL
jgi:hypothetical protein